MRDFGLRSVHVSCLLRLLDAPDGLSATELSALCGVDRAQISRVTADLASRGLVCETAPGMKRRYRGSLTLTTAGPSAGAGDARDSRREAERRQRRSGPGQIVSFL